MESFTLKTNKAHLWDSPNHIQSLNLSNVLKNHILNCGKVKNGRRQRHTYMILSLKTRLSCFSSRKMEKIFKKNLF